MAHANQQNLGLNVTLGVLIGYLWSLHSVLMAQPIAFLAIFFVLTTKLFDNIPCSYASSNSEMYWLRLWSFMKEVTTIYGGYIFGRIIGYPQL